MKRSSKMPQNLLNKFLLARPLWIMYMIWRCLQYLKMMITFFFRCIFIKSPIRICYWSNEKWCCKTSSSWCCKGRSPESICQCGWSSRKSLLIYVKKWGKKWNKLLNYCIFDGRKTWFKIFWMFYLVCVLTYMCPSPCYIANKEYGF